MNNQVSIRVYAFVAVLMTASLACGAISTPTPAPVPVQPTQVPPQPTAIPPQPTAETVQQPDQPVTTGGIKTFTDQNELYSIEVPSDWGYSQTTGDYYYIDQFQSPDELALVENIVYDEGTVFSGGTNGKFALYLLNTFYSSTGKQGDIRVTDDNIQKDGSERLTWISRDGGYSGISFFEIRNRTTFLMLTVEWSNSARDEYFDTLDQVIVSYTTP